MTENYDNFLSELGYKRKPKSFQVKKTKKKIDVKTPDESITFFGNGEWEFTIKGTSIKAKYPLGMRQLKEHINGTNK